MELMRPKALPAPPPSWWTGGRGAHRLHDVATAAAIAQTQILVQRAAQFQDLLNLASTFSINPRTSMEAMVQGTKIRMVQFRLKMQHKFPKTVDEGGGQAGCVGLTAATDFNRLHRVTLESTLGAEEDKHTMSAFISSKFEPTLSWGIAISNKIHQAVTFFSRYNIDDSARHQFILQVVHKINDKNTVSPICSTTSGSHLQAGLSWTHQLRRSGRSYSQMVFILIHILTKWIELHDERRSTSIFPTWKEILFDVSWLKMSALVFLLLAFPDQKFVGQFLRKKV